MSSFGWSLQLHLNMWPKRTMQVYLGRCRLCCLFGLVDLWSCWKRHKDIYLSFCWLDSVDVALYELINSIAPQKHAKTFWNERKWHLIFFCDHWSEPQRQCHGLLSHNMLKISWGVVQNLLPVILICFLLRNSRKWAWEVTVTACGLCSLGNSLLLMEKRLYAATTLKIMKQKQKQNTRFFCFAFLNSVCNNPSALFDCKSW